MFLGTDSWVLFTHGWLILTTNWVFFTDQCYRPEVLEIIFTCLNMFEWFLVTNSGRMFLLAFSLRIWHIWIFLITDSWVLCHWWVFLLTDSWVLCHRWIFLVTDSSVYLKKKKNVFLKQTCCRDSVPSSCRKFCAPMCLKMYKKLVITKMKLETFIRQL